MPLSLKSKLSKLRYKGQITDTEYQELIQKLEGHDRQLRVDAIDEFVKIFKSKTNMENALIDKLAKELKEQNK